MSQVPNVTQFPVIYFLFLLIFLVMYCFWGAKKYVIFVLYYVIFRDSTIGSAQHWKKHFLIFFFLYLTHPQSWQWSSKFWDFRRHQKVLTCERWLFKKFKCWDRSVNLVKRELRESIRYIEMLLYKEIKKIDWE